MEFAQGRVRRFIARRMLDLGMISPKMAATCEMVR
jgi:hypothetical protein